MKSIASFVCLLSLLSACGPDPDMIMQKQQRIAARPVDTEIALTQPQRFNVTRVGVFRDDLAYSGSRGIYVIVDSKTGREFVGISGVGVSELGSHSAGKTTSSDER